MKYELIILAQSGTQCFIFDDEIHNEEKFTKEIVDNYGNFITLQANPITQPRPLSGSTIEYKNDIISLEFYLNTGSMTEGVYFFTNHTTDTTFEATNDDQLIEKLQSVYLEDDATALFNSLQENKTVFYKPIQP